MKIYEYAQKALNLDETQLDAYMALVLAYAFQGRHEEAIGAGEQAVKVAPGSAHAHICLARSLLFTGKYQEALVYLERAVRMNPFPPWGYLLDMAGAHIFLRNHEEAVSALKKVLSIVPKHQYARLTLIVAYVEMGRLEEARAEAREFLMIDPKWDSKRWLRTAPWKDPQYLERWGAAVKKVGRKMRRLRIEISLADTAQGIQNFSQHSRNRITLIGVGSSWCSGQVVRL